MQCAHVLLGRSHTLKYVAQINTHGAALFLRAEELDPFQLAFEIGKEGVELLLRGRWRFLRHRKRQPASPDALEPFVSNDDDRLREIK